jgi:hypothetical protein
MMKKLLLFCLLSPVFRDDVAPDGTSLRRNLGHWLASVWPGHTMRYTRPRLLIFPDIGPHIFLEDGAMNFIEKSAIITGEYWVRVYPSRPNFAQ